MKYEDGILRADEGKTLRRKRDGLLFGSEIHLGYTWYINGTRLKYPLKELPEHYEELSQEEIDAENAEIEQETKRVIGEEVNELIRERYSLSEELSILRQRDEKPEKYKEYYAFCEECKKQVKEQRN